ncbi:hypothetical protein D3C84_1202810 [compost metagenome]
MGILHIEHRILIGLGNGQVHIEIQMRVHAAHREEVTNRIYADFVHQILHRNGFAGTFGHFDLFAILE